MIPGAARTAGCENHMGFAAQYGPVNIYCFPFSLMKRGAKIKASGASRQCSVHSAKIFEAALTLVLWLSGCIYLHSDRSLTIRLASANLFTLHSLALLPGTTQGRSG
jgi:hypothetical protein